jgi:hypothetical protein
MNKICSVLIFPYYEPNRSPHSTMRAAESKEKDRDKVESHKPTYSAEGADIMGLIKAQKIKYLGHSKSGPRKTN